MLLTGAEIGVLLVAPWPLYRLLCIPVLRSSYFCFALRVAVVLLAYLVVVGCIAAFSPPLLHVAAAIAVVILFAERLRARTGYGAGRNLPPGSLSLVPRQPWVDDQYFMKLARQFGPVFKTSHYFRPMICVIGARRGRALLNAHDDCLRPPEVRFNRFIPRGFLRYMAPPDHDKYKKLLQRVISPSLLRRAETDLRAAVRCGVETLASASAARPRGGVDPRRYLSDMLFTLFAALFFGIRKDDDMYTDLEALFSRIDIKKASCSSSRREVVAAARIADLICAQLSRFERRHAADQPVPPCVLAEFVQQGLVAEFDRTVVLNLVYIVQAGRADLAGLLVWTLKLLCDNPAWLQKIGNDLRTGGGAADAARALAGHVIKEVLRMEQSEFLFRRVARNIDFDGFVIPKGWLLRICIREGHRGPDIFADPERFDPQRFEQQFTKDEYSPLGVLQHSCLGAQIVHQVGTQFVVELARRYRCTATSDGARIYGRAHWEPSSRFRIAVTPAESHTAPTDPDYGRSDISSA